MWGKTYRYGFPDERAASDVGAPIGRPQAVKKGVRPFLNSLSPSVLSRLGEFQLVHFTVPRPPRMSLGGSQASLARNIVSQDTKRACGQVSFLPCTRFHLPPPNESAVVNESVELMPFINPPPSWLLTTDYQGDSICFLAFYNWQVNVIKTINPAGHTPSALCGGHLPL